jgi:hypothetical protein
MNTVECADGNDCLVKQGQGAKVLVYVHIREAQMYAKPDKCRDQCLESLNPTSPPNWVITAFFLIFVPGNQWKDGMY